MQNISGSVPMNVVALPLTLTVPTTRLVARWEVVETQKHEQAAQVKSRSPLRRQTVLASAE
jgi:hypothetical protein